MRRLGILPALLSAISVVGAAGEPDRYDVSFLPGRGEVEVVRTTATGEVSSRSFRSGDDDASLRIEPGNSYLLPSSLWDRFSGSRRGAFRIDVTTRDDEAVLASGKRIGQQPADGLPGYTTTRFEGAAEDRGVGLYIVIRPQRDGAFPPDPGWVRHHLGDILGHLEARFGPVPGGTPRVVEMSFPVPLAKAFPGAILMDRRLVDADAPPAGRIAVLAHELGHLWWGNRVLLRGPGAATLREGLAEWGGIGALQALLGRSAADRQWRLLQEEYMADSEALSAASASLSHPGSAGRRRALRYARSAWVLRMLEAAAGEAALRDALRAAARLPELEWDGLLDLVQRDAGQDLSSFRQGWVRGSGHPDLHPGEPAEEGVRLANRGTGPGPVAVELRCPDGSPRRLLVALQPGESRVLDDSAGCEIVVDPERLFLAGPPGPPAPSGIRIGRAWGRPVVTGVDPGSHAARAGLAAGDLLLAADGLPLDEKDVSELRRRLAGERPLLLKVRRGAREWQTTYAPGG